MSKKNKQFRFQFQQPYKGVTEQPKFYRDRYSDYFSSNIVDIEKEKYFTLIAHADNNYMRDASKDFESGWGMRNAVEFIRLSENVREFTLRKSHKNIIEALDDVEATDYEFEIRVKGKETAYAIAYFLVSMGMVSSLDKIHLHNGAEYDAELRNVPYRTYYDPSRR